jgi:hypothetical protein
MRAQAAMLPDMLSRRIVRYVNEDARDLARRKMKTKAFFRSAISERRLRCASRTSRPITASNASA